MPASFDNTCKILFSVTRLLESSQQTIQTELSVILPTNSQILSLQD